MTGTKKPRGRNHSRVLQRTRGHQSHEPGNRTKLAQFIASASFIDPDDGLVEAITKQNNAGHAVFLKAVSFKTMHEREIFYKAFFKDLRDETKYRNVEPRRLSADQVKAMALVWEARDLSVGTIANYLSYLRTWCQWTNRPPQTVRDAEYYYGEGSPLAHRRQEADEDHSWIAAGIEHAKVLPSIVEICPYVGIQTEFSLKFALRPKEARCTRPHEAVIAISEAIPDDIPEGCAATHCLRVEYGTKGDRPRDVPIVNQEQWDLINRAKAMVAPGQHLGRPGYSLKANTAHYYRVLAKVGITRKLVGTSGHGLRHERAGNEYHASAGVPPPVRGGTAPDRKTDRKARAAVAKLLGHNRPQISSCYLGSPVVMRSESAPSGRAPTEAPEDNHSPKTAPHRDEEQEEFQPTTQGEQR
ncbi:MAG: integrase domain-containing protein [Sterolibacteriaceae bacterium]|nr:integrase domain-containing protein [Sterolibacteriaceae bacterium]